MKKFLALFLALITILSVSLVACGKKDGESTNTTAPNDDLWTGAPIEPGTDSGSDSTPVTTLPPVDLTWVEDTARTTVYVTYGHNCNIRTEDSTSSTIVGEAVFGQAFQRIKYNDVWTVIEYNGNQRYIQTAFLDTIVEKVTFEPVENLTVYVKPGNTLNLRWALWSEETKEATLALSDGVPGGTALTVTGKNSTGWYRISYDGKTLYCSDDYVTTVNPADGTGTETATPTGPSMG